MTKDPKRERVIADLATSIKEKRGGLFVGAGLSAISGLPTWKGLLRELIERLQIQPGVMSGVCDDATKMLEDRSKWLILAQLLRNELGQDFINYISDRFASKVNKPNDIHLTSVRIPWGAIVTTNYDRLIERAFAEEYGGDADIPAFTFESPQHIASSYRRGVQFILKAHGDAREAPESVVLTETDYRRLVHREIGYQAVLQSIFTTHSFLFLGCSLSDPDVRLLLGFLHSAFHGDTPTHYALVPADERLNAEDKILYSEFRIHVIPIDPNNREQEMLLFVNELKVAVEAP